MNKPPNPEGNTYVLASVQPPQRGFPAVTFLLCLVLIALGWFGHDFYIQDSVLPTVTPVPTVVATVEQPDVAQTVFSQIAAVWTPTNTPTTVPTLAPTPTHTIEEQKFMTLPYCDTLAPTDSKQECILFNPLPVPTPAPFPTQTPVPTCPSKPIQSSIQSICVHEPPWIYDYVNPIWK